MDAHDTYYHHIKEEAETRILALFEGNSTSVYDIIGHEEINTEKDLHCLMTYIEKHGNCCEKVAGSIASCEWIMAHNELQERAPALAVSAAIK